MKPCNFTTLPFLPRSAFTLIELILVMALLVTVLGVSFPTLKNFFKGRNLDSEARRLLTLTRYGQSRAVSEGVPMLLWIDAKRRAYGLQIQTGYVDSDPKAVEYTLDENLEIEAHFPLRATQPRWKPTVPGRANVPTIRLMPDGSIGEASPDRIVIRQGDFAPIWIAQNTNRLSYAIERNDLAKNFR